MIEAKNGRSLDWWVEKLPRPTCAGVAYHNPHLTFCCTFNHYSDETYREIFPRRLTKTLKLCSPGITDDGWRIILDQTFTGSSQLFKQILFGERISVSTYKEMAAIEVFVTSIVLVKTPRFSLFFQHYNRLCSFCWLKINVWSCCKIYVGAFLI